MPEAPAAVGGVQLGGRLPTHRRGRVHTELADLALVQVQCEMASYRCSCLAALVALGSSSKALVFRALGLQSGIRC